MNLTPQVEVNSSAWPDFSPRLCRLISLRTWVWLYSQIIALWCKRETVLRCPHRYRVTSKNKNKKERKKRESPPDVHHELNGKKTCRESETSKPRPRRPDRSAAVWTLSAVCTAHIGQTHLWGNTPKGMLGNVVIDQSQWRRNTRQE